MEKSPTYAAKKLPASGGLAPRPLHQRLYHWTPLGAQPQTPSFAPILAILPQTQDVWIKPC